MDPIEPIILSDAELRAIERNARQMRSDVVAGGFRAMFRAIADAMAAVLHRRPTVRG